jgi:hypothetical protein
MAMIVIKGFGLLPNRQIQECLQCGHIEAPDRAKQTRGETIGFPA